MKFMERLGHSILMNANSEKFQPMLSFCVGHGMCMCVHAKIIFMLWSKWLDSLHKSNEIFSFLSLWIFNATIMWPNINSLMLLQKLIHGTISFSHENARKHLSRWPFKSNLFTSVELPSFLIILMLIFVFFLFCRFPFILILFFFRCQRKTFLMK